MKKNEVNIEIIRSLVAQGETLENAVAQLSAEEKAELKQDLTENIAKLKVENEMAWEQENFRECSQIADCLQKDKELLEALNNG